MWVCRKSKLETPSISSPLMFRGNRSPQFHLKSMHVFLFFFLMFRDNFSVHNPIGLQTLSLQTVLSFDHCRIICKFNDCLCVVCEDAVL